MSPGATGMLDWRLRMPVDIEQDIFGVIPFWLISVPDGVRYLATVTKRPLPSASSYTLWIFALPNVFESPMTAARLLSWV